jgi:DNA segregation ATPase FtsK/SpoIIIE-like protein
LDRINEEADRRLEVAQKRETEEKEKERERERKKAHEAEERAAHELEERAAGRQRSKDRYEVRAALEEGLAALEDEDDDENENDADVVMGGNAIIPAGGTARSLSHPQLHCIPSPGPGPH